MESVSKAGKSPSWSFGVMAATLSKLCVRHGSDSDK